MPNRILREGILTSERVNLLSWEEEVFYRRLMSVVDDFGRYSAHPSLLRAALYPLKLDTVRDANMERLLTSVEQARLVRVYEVAGKRFLEMLDFKQQVRAKDSKYPPPPSNDVHTHSICIASDKQMRADAHVDGGGGVGGDEVVNLPPPCANEKKVTSGGPFQMFANWKPSEHIQTLAKQSGLAITDDAVFKVAHAEFVAYWMSQPRTRTQHEWDHGFVKALKDDLLRGASNPKGKVKSLSAAQKPWFLTASGIEGKAAELGISRPDSEAFPAFKIRVYQAAGVTEDMIRTAKSDLPAGAA